MTSGHVAEHCVTSEPHCITCSDEGIELTVVGITQCGAQCQGSDGVDQRVEIDLVEPVEIGDRLLVHAGVAIANMSNQPASS